VESTTLVRFSKLVSDSSTSERIFSLLGKTAVEECGAAHALVFGTNSEGDFVVLSSYGSCDDSELSNLELAGVCSIAELQTAVERACGHRRYVSRTFPLISDTRLFGALVGLYSESTTFTDKQLTLTEGLTELTAISLNKTYQHQKLLKAFDDLRLSQDALVRSEKFRALGQMSAGIAHDLRNLLNPLQLYIDMIRDEVDNRDEVLEITQRVDRILSRGLETVERLRDFSRQSSEESEAVPTDLSAMAREAIEISRPRFGQLETVSQLEPGPAILVRPADCVTAIVNLIFNAIDALEGKGRVNVRTGESGGGAFIEVMDNGPGMRPEIKNRILEPFFTTKGTVGTGLGVSIVDAFTQRHGGQFIIESEPGKGATFRMWFPAAGTSSRR